MLEEAKKYKVAGHAVAFPKQPYGVQLVFMDKLIRTVENKENALLEAPTGCGKTLALLCGALAWQQKFKAAQLDEAADSAALEELALTPGNATIQSFT
jgi:Fanconi anemia group J protein